MTRVLAAVVLVPVVLAVVIWAPWPVFATLVLLVALMALREFYDLAQAQGLEPYRALGLLATAVVVLVLEVPWPFVARDVAAVLLAVLLAVLARALSRPERMATALGDAGATLVGILYLGLLMGVFGGIRSFAYGEVWLVFLLAVVWLGDTAALYGGKLWGRRLMAPQVSPKKTWEGAASSLLVAAAVGFGFGHWFAGDSLRFLGLAVAMNLAAQAGDLVESLFKRGAQVKDSGALIPGHGGVLDRIDAMLWAAPILWYYLAYFHT